MHRLLYILFLFFTVGLSAQEFQKAFTEFNVANDFSLDQGGNIYCAGYTSFALDPNIGEIVSLDIINKLDNNGEARWSKQFSIDNAFTEIYKVLALPNGDIIALFGIDQVSEQNLLGIARISSGGNLVWSQSLDMVVSDFDEFSTQMNLMAADDDNFFVQSKKVNAVDQIHFLTKFNSQGQTIWSKSYRTDLKINNSIITTVDDEHLALLGHYTADVNATIGMLSIIDAATGEIETSASFNNIEIQAITSFDDEFILKYKISFSSNAGIMSLNNNLEINWGKEIDFKVEGQIGNFQKVGDDLVLYIYNNSTRVELLASYDRQGNLNWAKFLESKYSGRPFTEKLADADGSILMMSHIWTIDLRSSIFRKLPADGNAESCILPIACVSDTPFTTPTGDLNLIEGITNPTLQSITIVLTDRSKSTSDFCQEAENVPSPKFEIDSTACINQEVDIFNTNNGGADDIFWSITGGPDDAILLLSSINNGLPISFADTGTYTITQFVEYQNCISSFEQQTKISDGLPFVFAEDTLTLCIDEIETVNANRTGFVSYLWLDDNSTSPIKKIDTPGIYSLELFDGTCTKTVDLVAENFDYGGIEFDLGPDTTVCEFRRFTLAPDNILEGVAYNWNDGVGDGERFANREGLYTLTVFLDGCDFSDDINVTFESCEPQLYMPNVFTPNGDGINDDLFPQGINYELESFRIYNRWGALLHDDITPWNGKFKDQVATGTYIYNISFLNIRSGDIETLTGSTILLR